MRTHHGVAGAFVAAALVLGAHAQERAAQRAGKVYETPKDVFKVAANALRKDDWKTFCSCLTPSSRDEFAGAILFGLAQQKGALEKAPKEVRDKAGKEFRPLDDLLARYRITADKMKDLPQPERTASPKDLAAQKKMMRQLSTHLLKDRCAFLADFMAVEKKMAEARGKKKPADFDPGALVDLKVRGDTAMGAALARQGGKEVRIPLTFHKGPNGWRMDVPRRPGVNIKSPPRKEPALPRPGG